MDGARKHKGGTRLVFVQYEGEVEGCPSMHLVGGGGARGRESTLYYFWGTGMI